MCKNRITLGIQTGSIEASDATRQAFLSLRKELEAFCSASYSPSIEEFAIILRISGSLGCFEGEGIQRLRINRKDAYVTADYVMPEERWDGVPFQDIKKYLGAAAVETVRAMGKHLAKLKIEVDETKLVEDVAKAVHAFLEDIPNSA